MITGDDLNRPGETVKQLDGVKTYTEPQMPTLRGYYRKTMHWRTAAPCVTCGAQRGEPCMTKSGYITSPHAPRVRDSRALAGNQ